MYTLTIKCLEDEIKSLQNSISSIKEILKDELAAWEKKEYLSVLNDKEISLADARKRLEITRFFEQEEMKKAEICKSSEWKKLTYPIGAVEEAYYE